MKLAAIEFRLSIAHVCYVTQLDQIVLKKFPTFFRKSKKHTNLFKIFTCTLRAMVMKLAAIEFRLSIAHVRYVTLHHLTVFIQTW